MSGRNSSQKSRIPSSPPSTTVSAAVSVVDPDASVSPPPVRSPELPPSAADTAAAASDSSQDLRILAAVTEPAKGPNASKPIVLGLVGVLLVGSAAIGGWYLYSHPNPQTPPRTAPPPAQAARVNPASASPVLVNPEPVTPPAPVKASAMPAKPVPKGTTPEAKKTPPKTSVKETAAAIVPQTTLPVQTSTPVPQPSLEAQTPTPAPQPPPEKNEERKDPPVTVQPAPLIAIKVSDGLPVRMLLAEDVPADAPENLMLQFVVASNIQVDDKTIIAKGAVVTASVAGHKKKILGIGSGKVTYQLRTVHAVDGKQLKVRAGAGRGGDGTSTNQFESTKDLQKKGFAAVQGTEYVGYIDTDQTVSVRK